MNYKYLGEAVALLGIAYSLFRWIIRTAPESDRPGPGRIEIDLARLRWARPPGGSERGSRAAESGSGWAGADALPSASADRGKESGVPVPSPTPDAGMLNAAAAMFGITTDVLIAMDPRERALLLSGYRAARNAEARGARRTRGDE